MNPLDSISISLAGLEPAGDQNGIRVWRTADGDPVGLYYFALPPDIPAGLDSASLPLALSRAASAAGSAAIEISVAMVGGCRVLQQCVKTPQRPTGMTYIGAITFPFRDFSYVLKIQCQERGMTGVREAVIVDEMLRSGRLEFDPDHGGMAGWMTDPYDPDRTSGLAKSLADDEKHDERFPDHPLSRARRFLRAAPAGITIADHVRSAPPFLHRPAGSARPWWKFW